MHARKGILQGYSLKRAHWGRTASRGMVFRDFVLNKVSILLLFIKRGISLLANVLNRVLFWVKCLKQGIKNRTIFVFDRVRV